MPKPKEGETKQQYISRCAGSKEMNQKHKDRKQRVAICYQYWENWIKKKGK